MPKNLIRLDYGGSPDLKEILSGRKVGDTMTAEVTWKIIGLNQTSVEGAIDEISIRKTKEAEGGEVEPTGDEPVMLEIAPQTEADLL